MQLIETRQIPSALRYGVCLVVAAVAVAALTGLGSMLAAQVYYRQAEKHLAGGYFGLATHALSRAADRDPGDFRIRKRQGDVALKLAGLKPYRPERIRLYREALSFYGAARQLNPLDAESAYGQARVARRLENLQADVPGEDGGGGGTAAPFYEAAVQLRPNGVSYRYAQLRYFADQQSEGELLDGVQALCRIYPLSYHHLRQENFWSDHLEAYAERGLEEAIAANIDPRKALLALASIKERKEELGDAVELYNKALRVSVNKNRPSEYANLSRLYIKTNDEDNARNTFLKAVSLSRNRDKDLELLRYFYSKEDALDAYFRFYQVTRNRLVLSVRTDIMAARALFELKRYTQAKSILDAINQRVPQAEAYYLLAQIAQAVKQWDAMELAAQKATVYGPEDSRNHQLFAVALQRQKNYARAEKAVNLALKYTKKPNPWMFNQRAWIRWAQKDYAGAVRDWKRAVQLKPEVPGFYAHIGEGYHQMGDHGRAVQSYTRAVQLAPENESYRKRLSQLDPAVATAG